MTERDESLARTLDELLRSVQSLTDKRKGLPFAAEGPGRKRKWIPRKPNFIVVIATLPSDWPQQPGIYMHHVGPFGSYEEAAGWAEGNLKDAAIPHYITNLSPPG